MLSYLLSKLPASRAADWGFGVSVGIVLLCQRRKSIVAITDQKVTFADFSADYAALKMRRLYDNCWVVEAGNDVEQAPFIVG